ncbi:MAG TPA: trypsin-like peptidase domain-containing protein [Phycisphaerae bacterium]|nr:trypsin-like peptidase domain-containing protein [Phycisphaerae bacterium]
MSATFMHALVGLAGAAIHASPDAVEHARDLGQAIRSAVETVAPFVVTLETVGGAQPVREGGRGRMEERFRLADGPTTGIILSSDGLILTSSFNFAREPTVITVTLSDGRRFVAKLLARDFIRRLALVKIDATDLPAAQWAARTDVRVGQYAIACGRALGGEVPSVSLGIVSAVARRNGLAMQTDAKTSPVNYGGPLIDIEGRVLGLIVPMAGAGGQIEGVGWYDSGIGFAIYKDKVDAVLARLTAGEVIEPGKIGVLLGPDEEDAIPFLEELFPQARGVRIEAVADPSPAAQADLQPGDIIIALEGQHVGDLLSLQRKLSDRAAGEEVTITLKRRWQRIDIRVRLARPSEIGNFPEPPQPEPTTTQPSADEESDPQPTSRPSTD